ncbi:MAG TPA: xanthine dehydrogenase family protein molybdopterin-binding subunit [Conexibacter sp.]|nr:xanthine dehydrogenase family protein molybdopterin-binding subunit [Conexibacter sp.]
MSAGTHAPPLQPHGTRPTLVGVRVPRLEDDRLVTGRGRYLADVKLPRMLDAAIVRSQVPHANVTGMDASAALALDGVRGVFRGADLAAGGVQPVPDYFDWAQAVRQFPLCNPRVRWVGAPLAVVVAEDRYLAEDAAELVQVDLEPLPTVGTMEESRAPDAPRLYDGWADNCVVDVPAQSAAVDEAFARLRVVRGTYFQQRQAAVPMEPRGVAASFEDGRLTVWTSTQFPYITRGMLSAVLGLPERSIRVIAPDVGGGFGSKAQVYPEEYLIPWLAMKVGRPVRWVEDRYEHMISSCHARDVQMDVEAAVHDDGTIEALRGTIHQDLGAAEMYPNGYAPAFVAVAAMTGPYRIAHQAIGVKGWATNKTPSGAYRGFGLPEGCFAMDRLIDKIGRELAIDPVQLRRRMILKPDEIPYETASGAKIDSGSHLQAWEQAVVEGERLLAQERAKDPGARIGVGHASYVEGVAPSYYPTSGNWTSQDSCDLRFDPDGGVTVAVGVCAYGQGLRTMMATLVAEELAIPLDHVRVAMNDTDTSSYGLGSFGSRSSVVAAGAIVRASDELRAKGAQIAAHLLEAAPDDVVLGDGGFHVRGSAQRTIGWDRIASTALNRTLDLPPGMTPGLEARATYQPPGLEDEPRPDGKMNGACTYTNASHAAIVRVDEQTGVVKVLRYVVVHDCGRVINPMIVAGQVHGGVVQGIGGVIYEELPYGDGGQPMATTFMDYLVPTAAEIPPLDLHEIESPAPETAYGVKGAGEAGIIGPAPAICRAVEHALEDLGVAEIVTTPLKPQVVRELIAGARAAAAEAPAGDPAGAPLAGEAPA